MRIENFNYFIILERYRGDFGDRDAFYESFFLVYGN